MKIVKKIGNILMDVVLILLLLVSSITVISSINKSKTGVPDAFGICIQAVESESMSGTFEKGDVIISKTYKEGSGVEVGQIISFYDTIQGEKAIVTHKITRIVDGKIYTQGTNEKTNPVEDTYYKTDSEVLAVYTGVKINKLGYVIDFLKKPVGFICCIALPLVAYITYQVIYIIKLYNSEKKKEIVEEAKAGTSEDVKEAIIREYLAKQKAKQDEEENK